MSWQTLDYMAWYQTSHPRNGCGAACPVDKALVMDLSLRMVGERVYPIILRHSCLKYAIYLSHGLTLIPARMSNYMLRKMWAGITYPFLNFNGCMVKQRMSLEFLFSSLQWRRNGREGVSGHQPLECLFNHLFRCRSKKTSKLRVTYCPLWGDFTSDRWIPLTKGQ